VNSRRSSSRVPSTDPTWRRSRVEPSRYLKHIHPRMEHRKRRKLDQSDGSYVLKHFPPYKWFEARIFPVSRTTELINEGVLPADIQRNRRRPISRADGTTNCRLRSGNCQQSLRRDRVDCKKTAAGSPSSSTRRSRVGLHDNRWQDSDSEQGSRNTTLTLGLSNGCPGIFLKRP
jgi:hypothetical protein